MRKFWNWIRDDGGGRTLRLDGPIDVESLWSDGVTPKVFREDLYAEDGDVTVYINSPGGNVFAAAEIYTMIRDYPGHVTVKIDGTPYPVTVDPETAVNELLPEIYEYNAENLYIIEPLINVQQCVIINSDIGNVPSGGVGISWNFAMEQYFYNHPEEH